jgi:uncharacterized protein YjlB
MVRRLGCHCSAAGAVHCRLGSTILAIALLPAGTGHARHRRVIDRRSARRHASGHQRQRRHGQQAEEKRNHPAKIDGATLTGNDRISAR